MAAAFIALAFLAMAFVAIAFGGGRMDGVEQRQRGRIPTFPCLLVSGAAPCRPVAMRALVGLYGIVHGNECPIARRIRQCRATRSGILQFDM